EQLEIYREQYWLRHTGSLVEDFPGLGGILAQSDWERLVEEYLVAHPPTTFSLRDLGEQLPDFASTRAWLPNRELAVDMARLEWAHVDVFDAPEPAPLDPEKLRAVPEDAWERVRLVPNPCLRLLRATYAVVALRERLLAQEHTKNTLEEPILLPEPEPHHYAVCRRKLVIEHDELEPRAFALLSKLYRGVPLGEACEATASELSVDPDVVARELETWFATFTARGYVVDLVL
ncbi:MAG TPA: DNA-binding domain-containing protein, partial [Polyangiaceae bacterium]